MARRLVISDGAIAREIFTYKVAIGGVVKRITKACVSHEGVIRHYYPTYIPSNEGDHGIVWDETPITVVESVIDPDDSSARITFSRDQGAYSYSNHPDSDAVGVYLNPAVTQLNQYIIKVDQVSGDPLTGTLGTWLDIYADSSFTWTLNRTTHGNNVAVATISIAEDAGGNVPVSSTIVSKTVNFDSTVTVSSYISWDSVERDLVESKDAENADCVLTFNPAGYATGSADTSGSFNEKWHYASPYAVSPGGFTVNVTLVSGTAPTGSTLGADLTLDEVRQWTLVTDGEEDISCELDVTVSDGASPVTKRITMNSVRTPEISDLDWFASDWACSDYGYHQPASLVGEIIVKAFTAGNCTLDMQSTVLPLTTFEDADWLTGGPVDGNNYEFYVDGVGSGLPGYDDTDTWHRMTTDRECRIQYVTKVFQPHKLYISVKFRKVGGNEIVKEVTASIAASDGSIIP